MRLRILLKKYFVDSSNMKIGILTFHNAYNYGAVLQAYALQCFLEREGHQVEIVDYHNQKIDQSYVIFRYRKFIRLNLIKAIYSLLNSIFRHTLYSRFKRNVKKGLYLSKRVYELNDTPIKNKDVIIVGSDQLWNKKLTGLYDPFYWAEFTKQSNVKAITYAVCMNSDSLTEEDFSIIKEKLQNFSSLSVREDSLACLLKPLTSTPIHISLDPTLMVERTLWVNLIKNEKMPLDAPYILVYAILERQKVIENAKRFASSHNMKMIIMSPIAEVIPFNNYYQPSSPLGFMNAIAHASYVITSSFHGLAFSVIFHKEVYVMGDSGRNQRMNSLLNILGIEGRFVSEIEEADTSTIDYELVDTKLNLLRIDSQSYLKEAIQN